MDKIKSILSPGHSKDDELMYGSEPAGQSSGATGKVSGQGSHFASDDPVSAPGHTQDNQLASNTGSAEHPSGATGKVSGAGSHFSSNDPVSASESSRVTATDPTSTGSATTTAGPHSSNTLNKADPRVDSDLSQSNTGSSPYAAKAAGTAWSSHNKSTPGAFPEDDNSNPYAASHIDPRVDSTPRTQTSAQTGAPTSTTGQSSLPTSDPSSRYDDSGLSGRTSGPGQSTTQGLDPSSRSEQYGNTTGSRGYGDSPSQTTGTTSNTADTTDDSGKKSKIATVLGAVGLGGAAAKEKHDEGRSTGTTHSPSTTTGTDSYTSPTQSGQGTSHRRKESIPTTAYPSGTLDSPRAVAPPVGGGSTEQAISGSDYPSTTDNTGKATIGQTSTYGSHYLGAGEPTSSVVDPNSSDPNTYRKPETSHLGRDTAIGTGIGAAGLAAGSHGHHHDQLDNQRAAPTGTTGASNTTTFHDAVTAPTSQSGTGRSTYDSPTASRGVESTAGHHTGRDAALAGGAAGLGAGAYDAERHSGPTSSSYTDPSSKTAGTGAYESGLPSGTSSSTYTDPSSTQGTTHSGHHHAGRDAALAGTAGGLGAGAYEADRHSHTTDPSTTQGSGYPSGQHGTHGSGYPSDTTSSRYDDPNASRGVGSTRDHHAGRDAALAGTVGGVGAGAYEAEKHSHGAHPSTTQGSEYPSGQHGTHETGYPSGTTSSRYEDPNASRGTDSTRDHHTGRDAALAGAGAGVGAHELSKHDAEKAEKERLKEAEKQQKAVAKEEKQHEKALEKEEKREHKHHDKEVAKEEKREHKQYEKELAKEEKQEEKAEKKHEKELAKEEKREEKAEKKHEKELAKEEKHHHHGKEEAAGAAGATALGAHEYDEHHDNELGHDGEEKSKKPSLIQRILHPRKSKAAAEEAEEPTSGLAAADAADRHAYASHGDAASRGDHLTGVHDRTGESAALGGAGATGLAHEERGLHQGEGYGTTGTGTSGLTQGEPGREGYGTTGGNYTDARDKTGTGQYNDGLTGSTGTGTGTGIGTGTSALGTGETGQAGHGLTRESMTGQPSDHTFGEITDHRR